jgi:hypothetical protein
MNSNRWLRDSKDEGLATSTSHFASGVSRMISLCTLDTVGSSFQGRTNVCMGPTANVVCMPISLSAGTLPMERLHFRDE